MIKKASTGKKDDREAVRGFSSSKVTEGPCIAGIGASAGGFEAIRNFFHAMPADSGVAFIVVQHLDPTHVSLAAELFGKCTAMPVCEATDGVLIEANHVYTAPSDKDVVVENARIRLYARHQKEHARLPIDHFFGTLGKDCGARAIGIVLSGTGSDGTLGLKAIAAQGGVVLVQDPTTAQFDGMPRSAIASGTASFVLPVEKMPEVLIAYARHPYAASTDEPDKEAEDADAEHEIQGLIELIQGRCGYNFSGYKRATLLRRTQRRMSLRSIFSLRDYIERLKKEPTEIDVLFRDLMIGVTEFFRDPEAWQALEKDAIEQLVASKHQDEPIRIWVPACSTGEEAYTMAMVVLDRLRLTRKRCPLQIFATDTNNEALEVGRRGRYPKGIASQVSSDRLERYFVEATDQQYFTVTPEMRSAVVFGIQNLFSDPPFARVDLISCRNVLIYLEPDIQKRILGIFHFALRQDGFLFLGNAESNGGREKMFAPVTKKFRIYRRENTTRVDTLALPFHASELQSATHPTPPRNMQTANIAASIAQKLILDNFAPASALTNAKYEVLYFCGPTDEFLVHPRGAPTQDLLALVRDGLRSRVRSALREAATSDARVSITDARMKCAGGFTPVEITVTPTAANSVERLFLVVFKRGHQAPLTVSEGNAESVLVRQLEDELQATRDDLQSTVERFETATEELKVSNEEVISINEELRSLNEELESSKEELQSLNEELTTVNQQLEAKLRELEVSNNDLKNLLTSSDIATICLDKSFRIKWFTPASEKQLNLIATDIGRPITDLSPALMGFGLIESATAVLSRKTVAQHEFQNESGRWYIRRTLPYRTANEQISGVIVTYLDITDSHLAVEAANVSRQDLNETRHLNEKLRAMSAALASAEDNERRALAQDLHDDLGQILAVIKLKVVTIEKQKLPASLRVAVDECAGVVDQANRKLRAMAFQLSPPMLYELGLIPALDWMADEMHHVYKLEVQTEDDGKPKPMDKAVSATLFRAVRELLINVAKHADVDTALVNTSRSDNNQIVITVSDAGRGFDGDAQLKNSLPTGYGLLSVRERLGYLGGEMSIVSKPEQGTTIVLRAPLLPEPSPLPTAEKKRPKAGVRQASEKVVKPRKGSTK